MKYAPQPVDDVRTVFLADVTDLMVPRDEIPKEFFGSKHAAVTVVEEWFYHGLPKTTKIVPSTGIDKQTAIRHLKCILGSFQPEHNHKIATVAYLMSEWFDEFGTDEIMWKRPP